MWKISSCRTGQRGGESVSEHGLVLLSTSLLALTAMPHHVWLWSMAVKGSSQAGHSSCQARQGNTGPAHVKVGLQTSFPPRSAHLTACLKCQHAMSSHESTRGDQRALTACFQFENEGTFLDCLGLEAECDALGSQSLTLGPHSPEPLTILFHLKVLTPFAHAFP